VASGGPGAVDVIVLSPKTTLVEMASGVDAPTPLGARPPREFNKPNMRMKISVGAMPCVIGGIEPTSIFSSGGEYAHRLARQWPLRPPGRGV
jgi:hypothetical protein